MNPLTKEAVKMHWDDVMKPNNLEPYIIPSKYRHVIEYRDGRLDYYFEGKFIFNCSALFSNYELFDEDDDV